MRIKFTEYCGAPIVDVTDIIQRASILPETFTLVVNEMNGTVIGNEVLRKVNPTQSYSLGTVKKRFLARLYTADGILLYQLYLNPVGVDNSLTVSGSTYNTYTCTRPSLNVGMVKPVFPCYVPYVIKMYSGDGTHTLLREFLISTYSTFRIDDLMPDTDYEFELYLMVHYWIVKLHILQNFLLGSSRILITLGILVMVVIP